MGSFKARVFGAQLGEGKQVRIYVTMLNTVYTYWHQVKSSADISQWLVAEGARARVGHIRGNPNLLAVGGNAEPCAC